MADDTLLDRMEKQAWFHRYPRGWPLLLFVIASIGTAVSVMAIERSDQQRREVELDRNLTEISSAMQRRVTENIALLRAASALFATQQDVTQAQIAEFSSDLQSSGNLYGSLGVGWAPLLRRENAITFQNAKRASGTPDFRIWPDPSSVKAGNGPVPKFATPLIYLEPSHLFSPGAKQAGTGVPDIHAGHRRAPSRYGEGLRLQPFSR